MRFCVLRSGSSGNCTLIEHGSTRILLDAGGHSLKGLNELLAEIGIAPETLKAILVTHLHADHINKSTILLCKKHGIALHVHEQNVALLGNFCKVDCAEQFPVIPFNAESFTIDNIVFEAFSVSHDAQGVTSGFKFYEQSNPGRAVTYASDLGHFPETLLPRFVDTAYIILEANHDKDLLWNNPHRPMFHKRRVTGPVGHLSNEQTGEALVRILQDSSIKPEAIVLCHLSKDHNSPELALSCVKERLQESGFSPQLYAAERRVRSRIFEI